MQKEGQKRHSGLGREKPCKKNGGKQQKILVEPCLVGEREKKVWKVLKKCFEQVKSEFFKKPDSRVSIDRKTVSINQNRQRLVKKFLKNFDWSKNRLDQSKLAEAH